MRSFIISLLALVMLPALLLAQPLADRVPADALVYIGWGGSTALGPEYEGSHLHAIAESSDALKLFTETLPALAMRLNSENPQAGEVVSMLSTIGKPLWRHPSAFYFSGLDFTANPRKPAPKLALICNAGDDAAALAKDLQAAIDKAGKTPVEMKVIANGSMVTLAIGPVDALKEGAKPAYLPTKASFKDAIAQVHDKSVATVYMDVEGIFKMIDDAPATRPREQRDKANFVKVRDALGLAGVKSAVWTGAFDGKDFSSKAFIAVPSPRKGMVSIIDAKPIGDDLLKQIPSTATMFMACKFDADRLMKESRATAGLIDPAAPAQFNRMMDQFRGMTGLDLEKDLLPSLGDEWALYTDPSVAGSYIFSATLINRLKDPAKAEQSLNQLGRAVGNLSGIALAPRGMAIPSRELKHGDVTIHYLATPIVRPSWAIREGVLYVGLFPQVVAGATANAAAPAHKSILENESFVALRKRLAGNGAGGANATHITYNDLPKTAPAVYPAWLFVSGYTGFGDLFGVPVPAMLMPPLNDLLAHLAPAGSVSWVDEKGWHCHGVTPFPGAQLLGGDPTLNIGSTALMTSILLPSLNRARETANRVKCASNMRQIGQACILYANDNKGKYPPDMGTMLKTQDLIAEVFLCPRSSNELPAELKGANVDVVAAWVNANASYVYVGGGLKTDAPADRVVLYEKKQNHDEDGMNFLYGDGHVEWQTMPNAEREIQKAGQPR